MAKSALERFMRALVVCRGKVTSTMTLGDPMGGRTVSLFARVLLPDGALNNFREIAKPYEVRTPPRIQVGMTRWRCPECQGDCPQGHHGGEEWRSL